MLFLYVSVAAFNLIAILMRKGLAPVEYYCTIFFGLFTSGIVDRFTDKYDIYYFFDPYFIDAKTLWVVFGIYPAAAMMIVNWYPYHANRYKQFLYLLGWAAFSTLFEWSFLKAGYLHYHHWELWYSAVSYPFLYYLLILNLRFLRWLNR